MRRQSTDYAVYWLAHVLRGGDYHRTDEEQDRREGTVQSEDCIVSPELLVLEVYAQAS